MSKESVSAREFAFLALERVYKDSSYSNIVFDSLLEKYSVSKKDTALAANIFYGVLETKLTLLYIIKQYSKIPVKKIDPKALIILQTAIYQILFMNKIPSSAAVNEAVKLCKKYKLFSASGFVNGVLRSVSRSNEIKLPNKSDGELTYLSVKYSFPEQIIKLWQKSYGNEITEKLLEAQKGRPPLTARANTLKTTPDELIKTLKECDVDAQQSDIFKNTLFLNASGSVSQLKSFKQGLFHIQDMASQICCEVLAPKSGDSVLDVCSAPGGKSFTIAQLMKNNGEILSCDLYSSRLNLVKEGAKRLSIDIIKTDAMDAKDADYGKKFDKVLCDVPCSGLGIIRRKPELRYKNDLGLDTLPDLQYLILCNCSEYVASGGVLVYSTCTLNPHENADNANRFLAQHSDFEPYPIDIPGIKHGIDEPQNQLTLFPHINATDGFFISAFRKR